MFNSFNRFAPLVSVLAIGVVPFLAWRNNIDLYAQIRDRISKPAVDLQLSRRQLSFPWTSDLSQWEGTKVKMEGYYEEERFVVSREKDGKKGYLVFAPFIYRQSLSNQTDRGGKTYRDMVIVCLGWIPVHLKDSISMNYDHSQPIEYSEETHPGFMQVSDGFCRDPESETSYTPLVYITGIIRKGEEKDVTRGLNNWTHKNYFRMIDLFFMAQTFRLPDIDNASKAYIELIAETEEERANIPIPNTAEDVEHQYSASKLPYFQWLRHNVVSPSLEVLGKIIV